MIPKGEAANSPHSPPDVPALLRKYGIRPRKSLGQNFLVHQKSLQQIVAAAALDGSETVVEIGAGLGSLTYYLALVARNVVTVELDRRLLPALQEGLNRFDNVAIVCGDILKIDLSDLVSNLPYRVVANIPYHITSKLIRMLLERANPPERMILTIQQEVAQRIVAKPGKMNLLALSVQLYGQPKKLENIPARYFYPEPKVDSAIIRIVVHPTSKLDRSLVPTFFKIARAGFQQKRKQLRNSLSAGLRLAPAQAEVVLEKAGIEPRMRPQALELDSWIRLASVVQELVPMADLEEA